MFGRIDQVRNPDSAMATPVSAPQVGTDAALRRLRVRVVAVIQDQLLHIAVDRLHWVVVGAPFGQGDPVQLQGTHNPPRLARFPRGGGESRSNATRTAARGYQRRTRRMNRQTCRASFV